MTPLRSNSVINPLETTSASFSSYWASYMVSLQHPELLVIQSNPSRCWTLLKYNQIISLSSEKWRIDTWFLLALYMGAIKAVRLRLRWPYNIESVLICVKPRLNFTQPRTSRQKQDP